MDSTECYIVAKKGIGMNPQFNKGVIEMCILSLTQNKDRYGYELVEEISKYIDISEGSVYPILRRLSKEGYFETYLKESTEGPPRKYYKLSGSGREHIEKLQENWKVFSKKVSTLISRN
jgi:PadR family transcriptional regulator PadR